ncbi:MAG: right-handed parallel beta-helix repeat-containing protein [Synergistaceae bacterium]|nr:right-handed parallel beta-helix repeat-containing protein [Synergistaceae bacterium]
MKRITGRFFVLLLCALLFTGAAEAGNFSELQALIDGAAAGSQLVLSEDYSYDISADTAIPEDGIQVGKALTIDGGGHTVDAMGVVRVFQVTSTDVAFKNLTITKGGSTVSGGGIHIARSLAVAFENVKITKCGTERGVHTRDGGAAIFVDSKANVTFTDCEISENTGKDRAGGIYMRGNAVFTNTKIINNTGGSRGGGLYVDPGYRSPERGGEWGGNVKMYNCTISGNKGGRGGGVYVNAENETLNVFENCTIANNDVSDNSIGNGGGILFYNANAELTNCTIIGNKARYGGGFILDVVSQIKIVNCTMADNVATEGGGGLYAHDGSHSDDTMKAVGKADFMGCVIVGNRLADGTAQDVSVHYSPNTDKDPNPNLGPWVARYDGNFVSGGYNVLGQVDLTKPEGVSADVTITLTSNDVRDAAAANVLLYEAGVPSLKDNGGKVHTVALADNSAALELIPSGTAWMPKTDARGESRPQVAGGDAGAYERSESSSSGCSTASFPLLLLAFGGAAVIFRKR